MSVVWELPSMYVKACEAVESVNSWPMGCAVQGAFCLVTEELWGQSKRLAQSRVRPIDYRFPSCVARSARSAIPQSVGGRFLRCTLLGEFAAPAPR